MTVWHSVLSHFGRYSKSIEVRYLALLKDKLIVWQEARGGHWGHGPMPHLKVAVSWYEVYPNNPPRDHPELIFCSFVCVTGSDQNPVCLSRVRWQFLLQASSRALCAPSWELKRLAQLISLRVPTSLRLGLYPTLSLNLNQSTRVTLQTVVTPRIMMSLRGRALQKLSPY